MIFLQIFQHSYKSFSTNFLDQHDIKVALHKYVGQNWQFSIIQHGFWFIWLWSHLRGKGASTSCLMDVFNVGRTRKYICYGALLGGMMVFVSSLLNVSHSQMLALNNNLENKRSFNGSLVGNLKGSCWSNIWLIASIWIETNIGHI
jgi:hypothetical protein